jgi:pyruvate dehydrogenase E1 component alpha subunit
MTAGEGVSARAQALGLRALRVDGNGVQAVSQATAELVAEIRGGGGPRLLHAVTYRFKGHVSVDPGTYRDADEVARALRDDPLLKARAALAGQGHAAGALDAVMSEAQAEMASAVEIASAAPWPDPAAAYEDVNTVGAGVWR